MSTRLSGLVPRRLAPIVAARMAEEPSSFSRALGRSASPPCSGGDSRPVGHPGHDAGGWCRAHELEDDVGIKNDQRQGWYPVT